MTEPTRPARERRVSDEIPLGRGEFKAALLRAIERAKAVQARHKELERQRREAEAQQWAE